MSCGDVMVRRMVSASVLKRFRERLPEEAWVINEVRVKDVATIAALVTRRKDGKQYLAVYDAATDTLNLKEVMP